MTGQRALFKRRISQATDDAREARPACTLEVTTSKDQDGIVWVNFRCATHGAEWREPVGELVGDPCEPDTSLGLARVRARAPATPPAAPVWEDTEAPNVSKKGV